MYALRLVEKACYSTDMDVAIRAGVKSAKSSEEMMTTYTHIKEEVDKLNAVLLGEKEKKAAASKEANDEQEEPKMIEEQKKTKKDDERSIEQSIKDDFQSCPWTQYVERMMDSRVHLFAELETLTQNINHLKELPASKVKGTEASTVSICFSSNLNAEGITNPHCRNPPLRKDRLHKIGQAVMKARSHLFKDGGEDDSGELGPGDVFIALDGSKTGNHTKLVNWIKGSKTTQKTSLIYDYDSVKERKFKVKGSIGSMCQTETMLVTSHYPLKLPEFKYESVPGASKGSAYGPMKVVVGSSIARVAVAIAIIDRMVSAIKLSSHAMRSSVAIRYG